MHSENIVSYILTISCCMRNYSKTVAKRKTKQKSFIVSLGLCGLGIQTGYSKDN